MIHNTIYLRENDPDIRLMTYVGDDNGLQVPPRPAIIVLPGGAYTHLADHEGEPIAEMFLAAGFQAFVLHYSLHEKARFPRPLQEVSMAMQHIRLHAEEYHVNPDQIFLIGFSAGGHLAASFGTMWHREEAKAAPDIPTEWNHPAGMILSYTPTVLDSAMIFPDFITRIAGENASDAERARYSPAEQVDEYTVPAYLWHTEDDNIVPIEHALTMASRLGKNRIPYEMHIYPHGEHGLGMACTEDRIPLSEVAGWGAEAVAWAKRTVKGMIKK